MAATKFQINKGGVSSPVPKKTFSINAPLRGVAPAGTGTVRKPVGSGTVLKPARPVAPARPKSPTTSRSSGGVGGGYLPYMGGGSFGGVSTPAVPSEEDYLKGDSVYKATIEALGKQLKNYITDINAQRENYELDYNNALQQLGYIAPAEEGGMGSWNWQDQLTASGRMYQQLLNDFAARGMLQSQGFASGQEDLTRQLQQQYNDLSTARQTFGAGLDNQLTAYKDENTSASQAARAEAILRRAAQYGLS